MTSSDWDDWLPRAVEAADPDSVAMWYLGCNGFILKGADGTTLYIDPYLGTGDPPRTIRMIPVPFNPTDIREADAILATHEHTDHVHGPSQGPILAETGAMFYGANASMEKVAEEDWREQWTLSDAQFEEIQPGDRLDIGGFTIHVEPANDPDAIDPVSFVITYDDVTIFHGGDTKPTDAFREVGEEYDIDLAIVAFGAIGNIYDRDHTRRKRTHWYGDENDVVEIVNALQADRLLPSHWDMWKGMTADPKVLHHHTRSWPYPTHLDIVEIGDRVNVF